jgi:methyl-accepting chemotaxis protein
LSQLEFKETTALNNVSGHTYRNSSHLLLLLLGLGVTVAIGMASLISSTVSRAIKKLVVVVEGLADGDLTRHADLDTKDELGQMANALNRAMDRTRDALRRIGASLQTLTASSEQLTAVSADMTTSADSTAAQAESASAAAEEVSANVSSVAAGTEEMSASIHEIAQHASEASVIASAAVSQAAATNDTIGVLGEASSQIDEVVKTIAAIAEQTNLLALNATIEAARAGEMGKGFAVVATEVKELAQQTARATADVTDRIGAIQTNTGAAVEAIVHIGKTIGQINDATGTIAAAVEEQTATTNEIGRSASEAAVGSGEIARNILGVAEGAASTTQSLLETRAAATDVANTASELENLVGQFRY